VVDDIEYQSSSVSRLKTPFPVFGGNVTQKFKERLVSPRPSGIEFFPKVAKDIFAAFRESLRNNVTCCDRWMLDDVPYKAMLAFKPIQNIGIS